MKSGGGEFGVGVATEWARYYWKTERRRKKTSSEFKADDESFTSVLNNERDDEQIPAGTPEGPRRRSFEDGHDE